MSVLPITVEEIITLESEVRPGKKVSEILSISNNKQRVVVQACNPNCVGGVDSRVTVQGWFW
jgi:hypothetical protein